MRDEFRARPVFIVFGLFLGGVIAGNQGKAAGILLFSILIMLLSQVIHMILAPGPFFSRRNSCFSCLFPFFTIAVVFTAGAIRVELPPEPDWAFKGMNGAGTGAVVHIDQMIRRDEFETSALVTVAGLAGSRVDGTVTRLRCFARDGGRGQCAGIVVGRTLAVRGKVLTHQGGATSIIVDQGGLIPVERVGEPFRVAGRVDRLRAALYESVSGNLTGHAAWLVPAIVLGEGRGVPFVERAALSALGTSHVLSVSGLHVVAASAACGVAVAVIAGILAACFRQRTNIAAIAGLVSVAAAWGVCLLAASPPPAVRAAGMATMFWLTVLLRRRVSPVTVVSLTGILELLVSPLDALSISFQLSYAAVFGILAVTGRVREQVRDRESGNANRGRFRLILLRLWRPVRTSLAVSIGASLATTPLTVAYFNSAPLVGPLANLVFVPLFSFFAFPGAILVLLISRITMSESPSALFNVLTNLYCGGVDILIDVEVLIARNLPTWMVHQFSPVDNLIAGVAAGLLVSFMPGSRRLRIGSAVIVGAFVMVAVGWNARPEPGVTFLDVGKGDAAVVRCPSGETWLVDTGPPPASRDLLLDALARAGVYDVDGVILTHAHDDHFGGLVTLARFSGPFELALSEQTLSGIADLAELVRTMGGSIRVLREGDKVIPGCGVESVVLQAVTAGHSGAATNPGENDSSLVFRLGPPGMDVLFMGDLEFAGEDVFLDRGNVPTARILKVGHHGSRGSTSLEFLAAVRPRHALIMGWPNGPRVGPSDLLLERFIQSKSMVIATSLVGDVTVEIGKNRSEKMPLSPVFKPRAGIPQDFSGVNSLFRDTNKMIKKSSGAR